MELKLHESAENYLETILILINKNKQVRSIDVANELNYTKPSISRAMKLLRENDYINIDDDGYITLTGKGTEIARSTYERHTIIAKVLISIGVDEETAYSDSCKIEHDISEKTFKCIKNYYNSL